MRKVALFIAMSLDGYIADAKGGVDWLTGQDENAEMPDVYGDFIKDIDTVVMGWNTYHQVATELSPDQWVYEDLTSYVITHRHRPPTNNIIFSQQSPCDVVRELKQKQSKNIWICGGASIIRQLMEDDLIDEYYISVIPTLLGSGIRLFEPGNRKIKLKLLRTQTYNGITDLVYARR